MIDDDAPSGLGTALECDLQANGSDREVNASDVALAGLFFADPASACCLYPVISDRPDQQSVTLYRNAAERAEP